MWNWNGVPGKLKAETLKQTEVDLEIERLKSTRVSLPATWIFFDPTLEFLKGLACHTLVTYISTTVIRSLGESCKIVGGVARWSLKFVLSLRTPSPALDVLPLPAWDLTRFPSQVIKLHGIYRAIHNTVSWRLTLTCQMRCRRLSTPSNYRRWQAN